MDIRRVFASNLIRLRKEKGLSQEELAHRAKINRGYMSTLENCHAYVGLEILERLSKELSVDPADLLKKQERRSGKAK